MIYLDNAAATFPKPDEVYAAMDRTNRTIAVNAGRGAYKAAQEASAIIDDTKCILKKLFHAENTAEVVFTPSVTHAMNQVLRGLSLRQSSIVYITPYEHNAVARTLRMLQKEYGFNIELLPLQDDLRIDLSKTAYLFKEKSPTVVIATSISNVTGYALPTREIFALAKDNGAITVMDAAQAAGLLEIDMDNSNADIICFAGHKTLYGPFGIGGFLIRKETELDTVFAGGTGSNSLDLEMPSTLPGRYEAASPNIVAIAGLKAALETIDQKNHYEHIREKTHYLIDRLRELDNVEILGFFENDESLGIVSIIVDGYTSDEVGTILDDEFDIAVRTGYHCAPYIHDYLNDKQSNGTIRIGIGAFNTDRDIDIFIEALSTL